MKEEFKDINDMSDSRELLETKPNPIIPLFIYLLIIILVVAITWTYFGEIDDVVKANGVVRTNETISTVRNQVSGQVKNIDFEEGKTVKAGDTLFTMDQSDQQLQKSMLEDELGQLEIKLANLKTLKNSIDEEENLFNEDSRDNPTYERYVAYKTNISLMNKEYDGSTIEVNQTLEEQQLQRKKLKTQIENRETELNQLERLKNAIQEKENVFNKKESSYYLRMKDIKMTINRMEDNIGQAEQNYESSKIAGENSKEVDQNLDEEEPLNEQISDKEPIVNSSENTEEIKEKAKTILEEAKYELEQYINQQLLQVNSEIQQEQDQLEEMRATLDSTSDYAKMLKNQEDNYQATVENFKSDMLVQVNNDIASIEQQIDKMDQELSTLEQQMSDSKIKASIDGVINVSVNISKGDFLQAGTEVLTIVPNSDTSTYKVQLSILNKDIANTKVGDSVKLRVHSLPYQEYGHLEAEITKISTDATNDPEAGISYYVAEAEVENETLYSYKGDPANLKVGMTTEAHIVTESKKILYFLLEKIDLRD